MHQPPLPPPPLLPCKYWLVPNPTSKLREQNVSIQFPVQLSDPFKSDNFPNLGGRSLYHQSNLPFANSQFSHTISLKKGLIITWLTPRLPSPLGYQDHSILCWKSVLPFIEIVLVFQPCFHCCTNFTFHPLTTSCMNGLDLVSVVFRQHVNYMVDLISACFTELLNSEAAIVCQ